jgi:hypothetical protein
MAQQPRSATLASWEVEHQTAETALRIDIVFGLLGKTKGDFPRTVVA